ncbi:MAG: hypothetical protein JWR67_2946 [Mucilaginibacter sp.]|nr:hypothetical protein [Mucilaginibacter sp.]
MLAFENNFARYFYKSLLLPIVFQQEWSWNRQSYMHEIEVVPGNSICFEGDIVG